MNKWVSLLNFTRYKNKVYVLIGGDFNKIMACHHGFNKSYTLKLQQNQTSLLFCQTQFDFKDESSN